MTSLTMDVLDHPVHRDYTTDGHNDTRMYDNQSLNPNADMYQKLLDDFMAIDRDRSIFRYLYHVSAVFIVITNYLAVVSILISKTHRASFQCWLLLHVTFIQILIGGCICPFVGERLSKANAGLDIVPCKVLSFLSDALNYMSNVSMAILGVHQCVTMMSPRMLNGVSRALLVSIMIIVPWFVCVMLTAVLRLTMSEEHYGQCYEISDLTAHLLWNVLAYGVPLALIVVCCFIMLAVVCSPFITPVHSEIRSGPNMSIFVSVCMVSCVIMRAPFYFLHASPIDDQCVKENSPMICNRLTLSLDQVRLANMALIPLFYVIPAHLKTCFMRVRLNLSSRSEDCTAKTKNRNLELVSMAPSENQTLV